MLTQKVMKFAQSAVVNDSKARCLPIMPWPWRPCAGRGTSNGWRPSMLLGSSSSIIMGRRGLPAGITQLTRASTERKGLPTSISKRAEASTMCGTTEASVDNAVKEGD